MSKILSRLLGSVAVLAVAAVVISSTGCSSADSAKVTERVSKGGALVNRVVDGIGERAEQEGKGEEFQKIKDDCGKLVDGCGKLVDDVLDHSDEIVDGILNSLDETIQHNK